MSSILGKLEMIIDSNLLEEHNNDSDDDWSNLYKILWNANTILTSINI